MSEPTTSIFVYCEGGKHAGRRVAVTNFRRTPPMALLGGGGWGEIPASRAGQTVGTGYTLHGDELDKPGWALGDTGGRARVDHDLVCRKCHKPWTIGEEKLAAALDAISAQGVSEVSVVALAGIVQKQAES